LRTLLISDLHLGTRLEYDVLRRPEPLAALLAALEDVDRLVLLGDTVELMEGRPQQAMAIAEPVLRAAARVIGAEGEIVVVPGNHDRPLVRAWARQAGDALQPASPVPIDASPALSRLTSWLEPAQVRVSYPGVWLDEKTYVTHGHYLDQHLWPVSSFGFARGSLRDPPRDVAPPIAYETANRPSMTRASRWLPRPVLTVADDFAMLVRASTMPRDQRRRRLGTHLSPVISHLLGVQMRRASIPALARVVHEIGVDAEHVVFGHVHRLGPLAADDPDDWHGPERRPKIANTGSWLYEPLLVHHAQPPHPYWPGGAIVIDDGAEPRAVGLLDDLPASALH
jgi:hypothetical protein